MKKEIEENGMFRIAGEPEIVAEIRERILNTFKDLIFDEGPHVYTLHGKRLPSITTVVGQFEREFDEDAVATRYAQTHGKTKRYWLDVWKKHNLEATTTGTLVHEFGESMAYVRNGLPERITPSCVPKYYKEKNWLIPTRGKERAVEKFWNDLPDSYHFVLAEAKEFSNIRPDRQLKTQVAGTFDLLMYYKCEEDDSKSGLVIFDYKTNRDIYKEYNEQHHVFLKKPFDRTLIDEAKSVYTLQLSTYQIPLEDLGFKVLGRRLIWVKDDGTYEKVPVDDKSKILRTIL